MLLLELMQGVGSDRRYHRDPTPDLGYQGQVWFDLDLEIQHSGTVVLKAGHAGDALAVEVIHQTAGSLSQRSVEMAFTPA